MKTYLLNVLIALDQLVNALFGGHSDETLSARAYRNSQKGYWYARVFRKLIDCVFGWLGDEDHCYQSYLNELNRAHLGPAYK